MPAGGALLVRGLFLGPNSKGDPRVYSGGNPTTVRAYCPKGRGEPP